MALRVLFSGHDFKFLTPLIERCSDNPLYEVRLDKQAGHHIDSEAVARAGAAWADIVFCEWALGNAAWHSRNKPPGQLLVVRLHLQEVQDRDRIRFIYDIDWTQVDRLVLITQRVYDWMLAEFPVLRGRACLIYNPIDTAALDRPKTPDAAFNLGMVGIVPMRKRLDLAVSIWEALHRRDQRFRLFIKGNRPEEYPWMLQRSAEMDWYRAVYERAAATGCPGGVVFEPHGADMCEWYSKIGFILSTSDFEGSHQAVAEGMASGAIPAIRDWEGADRIYPPRYVFKTEDQAADMIATHANAGALEDERAECRTYARERFDQAAICDKLESLFLGRLRRCDPAALAGASGVRRAAATLPPVLILGYVPAGYRGGYRIRIEQEIRSLARLGCRVHFGCLSPPTPEEKLAPHRAELERLGCALHFIPCADFFAIGADGGHFAQPLAAVEEVVAEHGIDLIHGEALYTSHFALLLKRRRPGTRLVFDAHGVTPEEERMGGAHPARIAATEAWEREVLAEADLNVFVSDAMRGYYIEKYGALRRPHVVVPCCVADEAFPAAGPPPFPRVTFAYVGTLAAWQCGEEMIRLCAALHARQPDISFLFLMPQGDHAVARTLMERRGLPGEAVALAEAPHSEVAARLQGAHAAFLLRRPDPVNRVASPTKFAEYLAAGVPVVLTDGIGDCSALAADEQVGLTIGADWMDGAEIPAPLLDAVLAFADDSRARRETTARRCRNAAWSRLHWEPASERLAAAYRDILSTD